MTLGLQIVVWWMAFVPLLALGALIWAAGSGQFDDLQAAGWIPLDERDPEGWPRRHSSAREADRA